MGHIEKTVFISYRRTNSPWALAVYQNLTYHGYDVFFDYQSIHSGDFEQVILGNIKARAHFIVILTPSALKRCKNPGDWLRREIETALDNKRNVIPLMMEGFDFSSPSIAQYLTGKMARLKKYNGLNVPTGYFDEAMERLRDKYLNIELDAVLHPLSNTVAEAVRVQQVAASKATQVKQKELSAQEWFEQGYKFQEARNHDEAVRSYTEAIRLKPDYVDAYYNRGNAHYEKGELDKSIEDYTKALHLRPKEADAYYGRGLAHYAQGDLEGAIQDYTQLIRLKPEEADGYYNRGVARYSQGDLEGTIQDYTKTIRLLPSHCDAYWGRGSARFSKGDYRGAVADYQKYLDLGGTNKMVRRYLADAKKKLKPGTKKASKS